MTPSPRDNHRRRPLAHDSADGWATVALIFLPWLALALVLKWSLG